MNASTSSILKKINSIFSRNKKKKIGKTLSEDNTSVATSTGSSTRPKKNENVSEPETWMTREEIKEVNVSLAKAKAATATTTPAASQNTITDGKKRVAAVEEFVSRVNAHNLPSAGDLVTDDSHWHFYTPTKEMNLELPWSCWVEEMERVNASFPDFKFQYERAVLTAEGAVALLGFRARGTHTGEPYGFGPRESRY